MAPVTLAGKIYLLPAYPDLLPSFPSGTTIKRVPSGGVAPYTFTTSDASGAVAAAGRNMQAFREVIFCVKQ